MHAAQLDSAARHEPETWADTGIAITFRGMTTSPSVEAAIERWVARLELVSDQIAYCTVVVDAPSRRHRHGAHFHVGITLAIPDHVIAVSHDPGRDEGHTDVYVAIADAFRAARRQLEEAVLGRRNHRAGLHA
jgi:ribosome-associated translation inhibitor RaiA